MSVRYTRVLKINRKVKLSEFTYFMKILSYNIILQHHIKGYCHIKEYSDITMIVSQNLQHAYECVTWHQIMYVGNVSVRHRIFVWWVPPFAHWACIDGLLTNPPHRNILVYWYGIKVLSQFIKPEAINYMMTPTTHKEFCKFIGFLNHHRDR